MKLAKHGDFVEKPEFVTSSPASSLLRKMKSTYQDPKKTVWNQNHPQPQWHQHPKSNFFIYYLWFAINSNLVGVGGENESIIYWNTFYQFRVFIKLSRLVFSKFFLIFDRTEIHLGVTSKKKNSLFVDIVQIGGGEVYPMSTKNYKIIFWQKEEKEVVINKFLDDFSPKFCVYKAM